MPKDGATYKSDWSAHMAHRHYGLRETKPPATDGGPLPSDAWSGRAIIAGIVVVLIVLGVVLYGVSKIVTDAANTATSAPLTTGQGAAAPPPSGMAR
jgi:hypothetical protein